MKKLVYENPFYGKANLLNALTTSTKNLSIATINAAWKEATDSVMKALFHIIFFSMGDITNRQHNIFGRKKIDQGGQSANANWITYLIWLLNNQPNQFAKFLPLIVEYVGLRELVTYQIRNKGNKVVGSWGLLPLIYERKTAYNALLDLLITYINGNNPFMKHQVAKFVKIPRFSKRGTTKKRELLNPTRAKMEMYANLVTDLSKRMNWEIKEYDTHKVYSGFKSWKKQWDQDLEFILFSTKEINKFDQEQFTNWVNSIPSGARYRVRRRLLTLDDRPKEKWPTLAKWFLAWEKGKEKLQQEQRNLELKARTSKLTEAEEVKLAKIKKEAKVTTGASTLFSEINDLLNGKTNEVTLQSIYDKVVFDVPVLPIVDLSGSMQGKPLNIARIASTLALMKNPTRENIIIGFGTEATVITDNITAETKPNRFMKGTEVTFPKLIDHSESFLTNFNRINSILNCNMGGTNFAGIPEVMKKWVDSSPDEVTKAQRIEQISDYQVMLLISDGDLNNQSNVSQSFLDFQMKMKQWFGWDGIVVVWDIPKYGEGSKSSYFKNIENVIHLTTFNISTINQVFTKISDMDVIDIYTPLKSLYESNRYDLIKEKLV